MVGWQKMQEVTTVWCKSFFFDNPIYWSSYLRVKLWVITKYYIDFMIKIRKRGFNVWEVDDSFLSIFIFSHIHFSKLEMKLAQFFISKSTHHFLSSTHLHFLTCIIKLYHTTRCKSSISNVSFICAIQALR